MIITHGKKLMDLITDIIDITIIEENLVKINMAPANINDILDTIAVKTKRSIEETGKPIKVLVKKALNGENAVIFTDIFRINQIFSYLLSNA